jgi:carbamoyl-phosphate synthase small subunit
MCDVDTRALVRYIREHGAQNAIISSDGTPEEELRALLAAVPSMEGLELSSEVSAPVERDWEPQFGGTGMRVAVLDLGVKHAIVRCLLERGCQVRTFPWNTSAEHLLAWNPDGILLSNGPGDPSAMPDVVEEVKHLVASGRPVFGICLGHQILALSQGLTTEKMFNGHRGVNHPVLNLETGKCEITAQNHGFVVSRSGLEAHPHLRETHRHLNDGTVAGMAHVTLPVFSVQYHPEASAGPHDSRYLFDRFVESMRHVAVPA